MYFNLENKESPSLSVDNSIKLIPCKHIRYMASRNLNKDQHDDNKSFNEYMI